MNMNDLLTIVIPVKNEERNLPGCLENIKAFGNVIIVDSGSTDRTLEIAKEFGREVVQFRWNGEFPKKRNLLLRNYKFLTPRVMFLDADERIISAFCEELVAFLQSNASVECDVISCVYANWLAGKFLRHGDAMRKTAIVRVGAAVFEKIDEDHWSDLDMEIHEHIQPRRSGADREVSARLEHHDKRSLEGHWQKHIKYADWEVGRYRQLMLQPGRWEALTARQKKNALS